jgi:hypothetical protein
MQPEKHIGTARWTTQATSVTEQRTWAARGRGRGRREAEDVSDVRLGGAREQPHDEIVGNAPEQVRTRDVSEGSAVGKDHG